MSAEDTDRRAPAPLVLLWIAIALAPIAGTLLVLGGGGGLLRAGGALAMLAVVLVALGSVLARAGAGGRAGSDVEAYVGDEIEALRADIRADISRATKASHRVLGEQIAALGDTVEALRGQIEVLRSHVERNHIAAPAPVGAGGSAAGVAGVPGGVFRHTETVQVTTRQTTMLDADSGYGDHTGSVYGSAASTGAVPGQRRADYDTYKGRDEYTDREGYAGARRARTDDEPTGGWAASREVHVGERNSEIRVDDTAARMRTQDRWASVVQREPEPAAARRASETTGGRRRRDDGADDARYWSSVQAEAGQQRTGEQAWDADRSAAPPRALPAAPSGEPVPAWVGGRAQHAAPAASAEEPARVGAEQAQYRGGQYGAAPGGGYGWGSAGAEQGPTTSGDIYGRAGETAYGGTPAGDEYGRAAGAAYGSSTTGAATAYGRRGSSEYGATSDTADYGRGPDTSAGLRTTGYVRAAAGGEYGRPAGGEYGRAAGAEHSRAAGTEYGRAGAAGYGGGSPQYGGQQYGGQQYGEYQRPGHEPNPHQDYRDDEPTGRRSRHGDWR